MILAILLFSVPLLALFMHEPWWFAAWLGCGLVWVWLEYASAVEEEAEHHG